MTDYLNSVTIQQFDSPTMETSISRNEEYLEYRRLVFQELASESGKRKSRELTSDVELAAEFGLDLTLTYPLSPVLQEYNGLQEYRIDDGTSDSNSFDGSSKDSPTQQPLWDDSDMKTDLIFTSPLRNTDHTSKNNLNSNSEQYSSNEDNVMSETTDLLSHHSFPSETSPVDLNNDKSNSTSPSSPSTGESKRRSTKSHIIKQRNDRKAVLQKLSCEDTEHDGHNFGNNKPWYNPRLERLNSQNLKICYINDTSSSSEGEEGTKNKSSPELWVPPSPALTPLSPTLLKRNNFNRMQSSSSVSSASSGGYRTSTSSPLFEIINVRASVTANETPQKPLSRQQQLANEAQRALTEAHQKAKQLAEEERQNSRKASSSSFENLSLTALNGEIRSKVKSRSLNRNDCRAMSISKLQVILNSMHSEKEQLNIELKTNLEMRDELRTEQDAKLIDVDDLKVMLDQTGPETTV